MAILITGGKGFVGSNLVSFFAQKKKEFLLFDGDISDRKTIDRFKSAKDIDIVIHLAGVADKRKNKVFEDVNVKGTKNIIDLCQRIRVKKIIFLSSIRVLSKFNNPYVDSKRIGEELIVNSGVPYIILRSSMIYGPGDKKNIGFLVRAARYMPFMPVLNFRMQPIFINDIIKIISSCVNLNPNAIINIAGLEIITFNDLLKRLKSFGYKFCLINLPSFFSLAVKIFSLLPLSPIAYWQIKGLVSDEIIEEYDWQDLLKIKPTPFSEGLAKTIKAS